MELGPIKQMIEAGVIVVAVGGGGVPVVRDATHDLRGVEAVIDKDLGCSLLARAVNADLFLITTAVEKVALHFGTPQERTLSHLSLAEAKQYLAEGTHFAKGSMAPKIQAVIDYLEGGGRKALITDPGNLERALSGETGTRFTLT